MFFRKKWRKIFGKKKKPILILEEKNPASHSLYDLLQHFTDSSPLYVLILLLILQLFMLHTQISATVSEKESENVPIYHIFKEIFDMCYNFQMTYKQVTAMDKLNHYYFFFRHTIYIYVLLRDSVTRFLPLVIWSTTRLGSYRQAKMIQQIFYVFLCYTLLAKI